MNGSSHARVTLHPRRLWSLRLSLGATRWVLYAVALVGVAATVHNAVDPPSRRTVSVVARAGSDTVGEWFAISFARAYLTWSGDLGGHEQALAPFLSAVDDPDAGLNPAPGTSEQVAWTAIAGERSGPGGERDYTVAAGMSGGAVRFLVVAVAPGQDGQPVLAHYPALVAAPALQAAGPLDGSSLPAVTNAAVIAVLDRALRNYIDGSAENLAADLAPAAVVDPVPQGMSPSAVQRLSVEPSGGVLAAVLVDDHGDAFTLAYQVSVTQIHGRWEITRIGP
jgi:hypothetical protein